MVHEIENFFGVYLLYSTNPKYKGWTYVGFTVDPNRRINQHNKGKQAGGAWRTSGRGPWDMVLIVHGFPNQISALRFEWAWQNPETSRRLKTIVPKKKSRMTMYQHKIQIVCTMLRTGPWSRLPLTIRWLKQEYAIEFDPLLLPPSHMPVVYGPVRSKKIQKKVHSNKQSITGVVDTDDILPLSCSARLRCSVCLERVQVGEKDVLECIVASCNMKSHTLCLAQKFLAGSDQMLPVQGNCTKCGQELLWGDLIRKKLGCRDNMLSHQQEVETEEGHWTDELNYSQS